jgi:hypothetical protein
VRKYPVVVAPIVALALTVVGCAKPPTEEINAAMAAVNAARDEGAAVYASAEFGGASKALSDAETGVTTKKYDEAKTYAIQAKEKADSARQLAITNKAAAKIKAEAAIGEADSALKAGSQALAGAPKGKGTEEDIGQLNLDLERATSLLAGGRQKMESADYYAAAADAEKVSAEARRIVEAVEIAKQNLAKAKEKAPWWTSIGEK